MYYILLYKRFLILVTLVLSSFLMASRNRNYFIYNGKCRYSPNLMSHSKGSKGMMPLQ